jgi:hypothetical protein
VFFRILVFCAFWWNSRLLQFHDACLGLANLVQQATQVRQPRPAHTSGDASASPVSFRAQSGKIQPDAQSAAAL